MHATLHVTNGDAAIPALRAAGVTETILPWRDVLHDGPVPCTDWPALRKVRAEFIASRGWGRYADVLEDLTRRDEAVLAALEGDQPVTLWFEHDLYDQLQLLQVLALAAQPVRDGARLALVQTDDYIGHMSPEALRDAASRSLRVGPGELALAEQGWRAFTASTPGTLEAFAHAAGEEDEGLPYLRPALQRLLQELPNPVTGLSRTELQALRALADGPRSVQQVYVAAHHDAESPIWMGDSSFTAVLDALADTARSLITRDGDRVQLTDDGHAVLAGRVNRLDLCGIDRWIGGVHLQRTAASQ